MSDRPYAVVREAVHRAAVDDQLIVNSGSVHLVDEAGHLLGRDTAIDGAVTDQDLRYDLAWAGWVGGLKAAVNADHAG